MKHQRQLNLTELNWIKTTIKKKQKPITPEISVI